MKNDLDLLLHLLGTLGADAAWLLRGAETAELTWNDGEKEQELSLLADQRTAWSPLLIARFPDDGNEDLGLTDLRLPPGGDREIQAAAALSIALDRLTKLGPNTTRRVLEWVLNRYGCGASLYAIRDRRPSRPQPPAPAPEPAPAPDPLPEISPPDPAVERGAALRARRIALALSQAVLADRAKVKQPILSQIERGERVVHEEVWERIEAVLRQVQEEKEERKE